MPGFIAKHTNIRIYSFKHLRLFALSVLLLGWASGADAAHRTKAHVRHHAAHAPSANRNVAIANRRYRRAHPVRFARAEVIRPARYRRLAYGRISSGRKHRLMHRGRVIADGSGPLAIQSAAALVIDQDTGLPLFAKNDRDIVPIASITKLMTAIVVLDAGLPMDEMIDITDRDVDHLKLSTSRLRVGARLTREQLLRLALMASENRAASALSGAYPGGRSAFVAAMNRKARALNMTDTHFADATGLNSNNVSTARDLVHLVQEGWRNPYVRAYTTTPSYEVPLHRMMVTFNNTNPLVKQDNWHISLSKTGFIEEAGRCLVMRATLAQKDVVIVLLNSQGKYTRIGDANRVRLWMEAHQGELPMPITLGAPAPTMAVVNQPQLTFSPNVASGHAIQLASPTESPALILASGRVTSINASSTTAQNTLSR